MPSPDKLQKSSVLVCRHMGMQDPCHGCLGLQCVGRLYFQKSSREMRKKKKKNHRGKSREDKRVIRSEGRPAAVGGMMFSRGERHPCRMLFAPAEPDC